MIIKVKQKCTHHQLLMKKCHDCYGYNEQSKLYIKRKSLYKIIYFKNTSLNSLKASYLNILLLYFKFEP